MQEHDHIFATLLFIGWELARWQEVIDWAVGIAGALTLLVYNVIRLHKMLVNKDEVEK
jgi:hypothetical protein